MDEQKTKIYIKVNDQNEITEINSDIFIKDLSGWIEIDEGIGDKYAHAQSLYLNDPLTDSNGGYNYVYKDNVIVRKS